MTSTPARRFDSMEKLVWCRILAGVVVTWVFLGGSHAQGFECPPFGVYYGGSLEYSTDPPFFAGATANLSCGIGYEPLENYTTSTCLSVGQWVPHKLQCELPCPELELTDFLLPSTTEHYPGVSIHFTCENGGYHMSGPNYLTCRNGSWSDRLPSCTEPLCDIIQWNDDHLDVQTSGFEYRRVNSTAYFSCDSGWRIVGAESITCLPGGVWSDFYPYCERDRCPYIPPSPELHISVSSPYYPGMVVNFTCEDQSILIGNSSIHCRVGGQWSSLPPHCEKKGSSVPSLQATLFPTTSTSSEVAILSSTVPIHSTVPNHLQRTPLPSLASTFLNLPTPISSASTEAAIHIERTPLPSPKVSTYLQGTPILSPLPSPSSDASIHLQKTSVPSPSYSSSEASTNREETPLPSPASSSHLFSPSTLLLETASSSHKATPIPEASSFSWGITSPDVTSLPKATSSTEAGYSSGTHPSALESIAPTSTEVASSSGAHPSALESIAPTAAYSSRTYPSAPESIAPTSTDAAYSSRTYPSAPESTAPASTEASRTHPSTPLPTPTKEAPSSGSSGSKVGPIAGGVAGGLAVAVVTVVVIAMVVIFHRGIKRHRRRGGYVVHATEDQVNLLTL